MLFRHKVSRAERKAREPNPPDKKTRKIDHPEWKDNPNLENLPELLQDFAGDLKAFRGCLGEFREVVDGAITTTIESFEADVKVCERCMKFYIFLLIFSSSTGFLVWKIMNVNKSDSCRFKFSKLMPSSTIKRTGSRHPTLHSRTYGRDG